MTGRQSPSISGSITKVSVSDTNVNFISIKIESRLAMFDDPSRHPGCPLCGVMGMHACMGRPRCGICKAQIPIHSGRYCKVHKAEGEKRDLQELSKLVSRK